MARPSVLPLPDSSVRYILAHIDDLRMAFPTERGNRPFLAAFLRLVYEATGEVFGASTIRKLLQTYAGEYRPSTNTIHKEIQLLRESLDANAVPSSQHPETGVSAPNHVSMSKSANPDLSQLTTLIAGLQRSLESTRPDAATDGHQHEALARALEAENQRIRAYAENLMRLLEEARQDKLMALKELESVKAERDTYKNVSDELSARVAELAEAVKQADERTASSHRFALGRIEDATAELRRYKELLAQEKENTAAVQKKLQDERLMTDTLRQALTAQRSKGSNGDTNTN